MQFLRPQHFAAHVRAFIKDVKNKPRNEYDSAKGKREENENQNASAAFIVHQEIRKHGLASSGMMPVERD
jgi:hypothetical protein